ncbi:uncharacterized protein CCOS01_11687 [Colletotrichum costaricense]|uniref:Uncharacterized protein n=2 Tax=Colletotrichum acutatum species complex TaxID=2707335 RepID=A0AAI9YPW8_9PEZI|nr:uncharacterized protein CCOS01_11687 [Colletotrichum costaricense]XP_060382997.1 uncharacterized protein CTAM01_06242 [Colletotrichum tamarilloi]KAI3537176.1 hypothetical protein CSPX01_10265 [Colletotrichum filicis]KAK1500790.1 hypothetical protein CTAM01_06242 [Colletotrichum tamarilloi]KAK1518867.1 hypothetical protein CCOS01_11687 [Colletotrichum costaricense]
MVCFGAKSVSRTQLHVRSGAVRDWIMSWLTGAASVWMRLTRVKSRRYRPIREVFVQRAENESDLAGGIRIKRRQAANRRQRPVISTKFELFSCPGGESHARLEVSWPA